MNIRGILFLALVLGASGHAAETNATSSTNVTVKTAPRVLDVRGYRVEGNTVLSPAMLQSVLTNFTVTNLTVPRLRQGLVEVRSLYRARGYPDAKVVAYPQQLTNGILQLTVVEGKRADLKSAGTNSPPPQAPPQTFALKGFQIEGNTVLPQEKLDSVLTNYTGNAVDITRIKQGLGELQLLYRDLGFATVSVTLPPQRLTNGILRVQVIEGRLAEIAVNGNRFFSSNNVRRALPGLSTNVILNNKWFQPELDRANGNPDRQIYPVLGPGPEPGTSALNLKVKDRLPLHGHMEINDRSTPGTPLLRIDSALQYNNLWQLEHQIGLQYNFSPQEMKSENYMPRFWDQPAVASYSGFYRLPLNLNSSLRENYDRLPVDFGYDQVTHKFNLPPSTGNPELIVYASGSSSEMPVQLGPITVITNTILEELSSQFAERDLTVNNNLGLKLTTPLPELSGARSSLVFGFDYKYFQSHSFTTNLTYAALYALDQFTNRIFITNQVLALDANSSAAVDYLPLSLGWSAVRPDKHGNTLFNINQNLFLSALSSPRIDFERVARSTGAGGNYTTINAGLTRDQQLSRDWSILARANGQWSSAPLISNEQFALGGTGGVRGYQEGANYGDTGWRVQFDLRAPPINIGYFPYGKSDIPALVRTSVFMDYGNVYLLDRPPSIYDTIEQWGTGFGFFLTVSQYVEARLSFAWALHETPTTPPGSTQVYFSVGLQF